MIKRVFSTIVVASLAVASFAGGLLTNTNQSTSFVRNPMRYASLETDAVYFNPAGTAFLKEGWAFSANWQMIWQTRDVVNSGTKYDGDVYVPVMPTFHAAYKTGKWTLSGFFGMPGGGGLCEFENGLPLFDKLGNKMLSSYGMSATSNFKSTQYLFSLQLGAAYQINDNWSVYGGIRGNYTSLSYEGSIAANTQAGYYADLLTLDLTQTGIAFAPLVGIDYKAGKLNVGVKYEFRAVNTIENDTKTLTSDILASTLGIDRNLDGKLSALAARDTTLIKFASLQNGEKFRSDAPAILSIGASYDIIDRVKVMAGYVYYFDKDACIESLLGKENSMYKLSRNTFELLAGVEVQVTDKLLLSTGIQFSDFGVNEEYLSDVSFIDDSFTWGTGGKYSFNENWDLNFGFVYANYAHGHDSTGSQYLRKTYNASVGVDFRF